MKAVIASIFIAAVTLAASDADLSQTITTPDGITIHLPIKWKQIPKSVIEEVYKEFYDQNPRALRQTFDHGFQADSEEWFSYPYILIQVQHTGRIPEFALKKMPNLDDIFKEKAHETADAISAISDISMGKTVYDSTLRILWSSGKAHYESIGYVKMLAGGHLTEDGFVYVYAYSIEADFPRYEKLFEQIISRIKLEPGIRYSPRISDKTPLIIDWNKALEKGIVGGVIVIFIGIVTLIIGLIKTWLIKWKNKDSQPSSSSDSK